MAAPITSFGAPINYGDWTRYAGFDSKKPMMGMMEPVVPPTTTPGAVQPVAPTISQFAQRVGDVGQQFAQGNFKNAANMFMTGKIAQPPATSPIVAPAAAVTMPQDKNGDGMISDWEE